MKTTTIGVCAPPVFTGFDSTFAALGSALGVSFEKRTFGDDRRRSRPDSS